MTDENAKVRLVLLGADGPAPVCEGDVCYLPESTVDSGDAAPVADGPVPEDGPSSGAG